MEIGFLLMQLFRTHNLKNIQIVKVLLVFFFVFIINKQHYIFNYQFKYTCVFVQLSRRFGQIMKFHSIDST